MRLRNCFISEFFLCLVIIIFFLIIIYYFIIITDLGHTHFRFDKYTGCIKSGTGVNMFKKYMDMQKT